MAKEKGIARDASFKDISPIAKNVRSCEDNPAKAEDVGRGTPKVVGKLGQ